MFGRRKKIHPALTSAPSTGPSDYEVILDVVRAHHERGTARQDVQRCLIEIAADSLEPQIRAAVHEVYGCRCPQSIAGTGPHFDEYAA
jgi:hypothetical protein